MSWQEIDLASITDEMDTIPNGQYVFELITGTKYGKFDPNKLEVPAKIAEGEFKGRIVYLSYPDPAKKSWSPAAVKRLEMALVKDGAAAISDNQDPTVFFNQDDVVGHKFISVYETREYTGNDGEQKKASDVKLFKVRAVEAIA